VRPALQGYAIAVLETAATDRATRQVADEMMQVTSLVSDTLPLATVLTDATVPVAARRAVVEELFRPRVLDATFRLIDRTVTGEPAQDVVPALHDLAEFSLLEAEGQDDEVTQDGFRELGRTAGRQLVAGYGSAVFEGLGADALESVEDELFRFARVVESDRRLGSVLTDSLIPLPIRSGVVRDLLEGRAQRATVRLACFALRGRGKDLVSVLDRMAELAADARGWRVGKVRSAHEIDNQERDRLAQALARLTSTPVEIQVTLDPSLLGGAVVQIGDLLVDSSARHRLLELHEQLVGADGPGTRATDAKGPI
jgi:F-type H+-transporting ATPase subunit delta